MARSVKVIIGGVEYSIPRLNMGQTEDLAELWESMDGEGHAIDANGERLKGKALISHTIALANIMFRRASPPVADVRDLEVGLPELQAVMIGVYGLSGLEKVDDSGKPPAGASPAAD